MKANKFLCSMAGLIAAMGFIACSSDDANTDQQRMTKSNVINLTSALAQTRAASDPQSSALSTSSSVGVFVNHNDAAIANGTNNQHAVSSNGDLTTTSTMNYPAEDGTSVDIYAYAPYAAGMALSSDNNFSVATDQSTDEGYLASDLVYATKTGQTASTSAVSLTFAHKLSKLNITINNTNTDIDLTNAAVYVTGTKIATTFNPSTGTVGTASGDATDIKAISALGTGTTACAVIVPQEIAAETELVKIVTDSKTLVAKLASATTFAAGSAYNFTVNISSASVELTLKATSVTDWNSTDLGAATMEEKTTEVTSPLYATFGTTGSNASYAAPTYTWTGSTSNLMTVFEFSNGELANYKTLTFTFSNLVTGPVRMGYYVGSSFTEFGNGYYNAGTKTVDLTTLGIDLSTVTKISFGGRSSAGSCDILASDVYLTK